ncbi:MAG: response regulator, partial [Alphaproteobacteria bacterium]|nr:response regulator [Alphaproteobacteria bacterium]
MGRTILIVDDDWSQREYLEAVITGLGYRAQTLSGGAEAIQLLCGDGNHDVDLVLLDLVMPGVDGIDVLRKVVPENPGLPVVVLTVQAGVDTVVEVMRAGAL